MNSNQINYQRFTSQIYVKMQDYQQIWIRKAILHSEHCSFHWTENYVERRIDLIFFIAPERDELQHRDKISIHISHVLRKRTKFTNSPQHQPIIQCNNSTQSFLCTKDIASAQGVLDVHQTRKNLLTAWPLMTFCPTLCKQNKTKPK